MMMLLRIIMLARKMFLRHSNRQESFLNTVARTYMMELSDEMLKSIRDEMLPLAEKWWEYDIWSYYGLD